MSSHGKGTSGRWSAHCYNDGGFEVKAVMGPSSVVVAARSQWKHNKQESHANAKLIAAAPDLLRACELVSLWMIGECPSPHSDSQLLEVVNSAIRKAKGEES